MKITLITLAYNEAERLPFFLRHYSQFVDEIIVYYNVASTDNTYNLLKNNKLVKIIDYDTGGVFNEERNQLVKNTACEELGLNADWYIVCDADEYLYLDPKNLAIKTYLQCFENERVTLPKIRGYQMVGEEFPIDDGISQIYDHCKYGAYYKKLLDTYDHTSSKQILFHKDVKVIYGPGGHTFVTMGRAKVSSEHEHDTLLKMLHYRYFTLECVWNYYVNANISPDDKHSLSWTRSFEHIKKTYDWFYTRRERVIK